jgi:predicted MPP superfamily phosphohydrolase
LKIAGVSAVGTAATGGGAYAYAQKVEPGWVEVRPVSLRLPRLAAEFDGYRIAQISDIHMDDAWMHEDRLTEIVGQVNEQRPDLVVMTGDFVTHDWLRTYAPGLVAALSKLSASDGVMAILGNHDHWVDANGVHQVIRDAGMIDLSNAVHTLHRGESMLHIAGVDDFWERKSRLDLVLNQLPESGAAVLLAHEPDFADQSAASGRFDLQLSGHSHGGQVVVPMVGPLVLPYLGQKYPSGLYKVGSMLQYTNRGLGMVKPQFRFNCRPEITVFTLQTS